MTAITALPTKRSLREHAEEGTPIFLTEPMPGFSEDIFLNSVSYAKHYRRKTQNGEANFSELPAGTKIVCTNHPRRSFFAEITINPDGSLKVR